ncbi:hypothetical protein ACMXYV_11395 [Neptuniibacter sp. SY11_33]
MMTFATLVAIAAGVVFLYSLGNNTPRVQPIRIENEQHPQHPARRRR